MSLLDLTADTLITHNGVALSDDDIRAFRGGYTASTGVFVTAADGADILVGQVSADHIADAAINDADFIDDLAIVLVGGVANYNAGTTIAV